MKRRHLVPLFEDDDNQQFVDEIKQKTRRKCLSKDSNGCWRRKSISSNETSPAKENKRTNLSKPKMLSPSKQIIKRNILLPLKSQVKKQNEQQIQPIVIDDDDELSDSLIEFLNTIDVDGDDKNEKSIVSAAKDWVNSTSTILNEEKTAIEYDLEIDSNVVQQEIPINSNNIPTQENKESEEEEWAIPVFKTSCKKSFYLNEEEVENEDKLLCRRSEDYFGESTKSSFIASQAGCIGNVSDDEDDENNEITPSQAAFINDENPTQYDTAFYAASLSSQCPSGFTTSKREQVTKKLFGNTSMFSSN